MCNDAAAKAASPEITPSDPPVGRRIENIAHNLRRLAGSIHRKADEIDRLRHLANQALSPQEKEAMVQAAYAMAEQARRDISY